MTKIPIIESICDWNKVRYEQVPMYKLTLDLLKEEMQETHDAYTEEDYIGIMDGYADVFFVAISGLWKIGLSAKQIDELMDNVEGFNTMISSPKAVLLWYEDEDHNSILAMLALSVFGHLEALLGNEELALDTIKAICVSNDTKTIVKTEVGIKANISKGENYVSPTESLTDILKRAGL